MSIEILGAASVGCVWGWMLASCALPPLKARFWTATICITASAALALEIGMLTSRTGALAALCAATVALWIHLVWLDGLRRGDLAAG